METPELVRVGVIGSGAISRFIHIPGLQRCPGVEVAIASDVALEAAQSTAQAFGIPAVTADYREVLIREDIAAVVVATPNHLHRPISLEALAADKHVLCEKPIALNFADAQQMAQAAHQSCKVHMVSFVYRFVPAIRYLKYLIDCGHLGIIRHFRAQYLQRVPDIWLGWRSQKAKAGSGAIGDIGSHLVDLARYLVGEIGAVTGSGKTFLEKRHVAGTESFRGSDVDDAGAFLAEFDCGATGVFEVSRLAPGRGSGLTDYQCIEVNGSRGTAVYCLYEPFRLNICLSDSSDDHSLVAAPVPEQFWRWPNSARDVLADSASVGFRYDQAFAFIEAIRDRDVTNHIADFGDGARCQAVLDAVLESIDTRRWTTVPS